ncbi:MAG: hypothetical protein ACRCXL_11070 [Dermatophilaceae bacterium]
MTTRPGWPLPRIFPAVVFVTMLVGGLMASRRLRTHAYPTWSAYSSAWHEALWVPGAVAAAVAAAGAALLFPSRSPLVGPQQPRLGWALLLRQSVPLGGVGALGWSVGLAPSVVIATRGATYGHLAVGDVVVGVLGVVLLVTCGYCAGAAAGHLAVAPVVGVVSFVVLVLPMPDLGRPAALFLPLRHVTAIPRFELSNTTTVFTVVGVSAVMWLGATAASAWRSRGGVTSTEAYRDAGVVLAVTATLVVVAFAWRPEFYVVDRSAVARCSTVADVVICTHPALSRSDDDLRDVVRRLDGAGLGSVLTRVTDESVFNADRAAPGEAIVRVNLTPLDPTFAVRTIPDQFADQIVEGTVMLSCSGKSRAAYDANAALVRRALVNAGFPQAAEIFPAEGTGGNPRAVEAVAAMDAKRFRDFMAENAAAVADCSVTEIGTT